MMKFKKTKLILLLTIALIPGAFCGGLASDNVEWNILKTLQLDATPIDVAITPDGERIYVLTDQGQILVYSSTQSVEGRIEVGKHVDQLKLGPRGDTLILSSGRNKTLQITTVDFIKNINTSGAPSKGREEAPIVIAVFDDFQ
jgi:DNA-binding beta-propeller fold protein YncE